MVLSVKRYEFITAFYPAPLVEKLLELNYRCWSDKVGEELYRNYVKK
jgi:hypothetical protein